MGEGGVLWPAAIPTALQPTPPASARWRPVCRWESLARLAKPGSFLALRPARGPWQAAGAASPAFAPLTACHQPRPTLLF
jgi:hypothetical protein